MKIAFVSHHRPRLPRMLSLVAIGVCILVSALLLGGAAPSSARAESNGDITGTVSAQGGVPLAGIDVQAYQLMSDDQGNSWWGEVTDTSTGSNGTYDLNLPAGTYHIQFMDYGFYIAQYYKDKPIVGTTDVESADDVAVSAGGTTPNVNATLVVGGEITGTVTSAQDGGVLGDIHVQPLRSDGAGGWTPLAAGMRTNPDGSYYLYGVPAGTYRIWFQDTHFGDPFHYVFQWFNDQQDPLWANSVAVTAGVTTVNVSAALWPSQIGGTVSAQSGGVLAGIHVQPFQSDGNGGWNPVGDGVLTDADGNYYLGLPEPMLVPPYQWDYRIQFTDPSGNYVGQCYNNKLDLTSADDVGVTFGWSTDGINATLTAQNVAPVCGPITVPASPIILGSPTAVSAPFTDPDVLDTHTAVWSWGDGKSSAGTVTESNGSGTVAGTHTYAAAGLYTVSLKVTDNDGASGTCTATQYVIVYNSCKGCVCGCGAIDSPAGAFPKNPKAVGKATFSFTAGLATRRHVRRASTQFQLRSGSLLFRACNIEWLRIAGPWAQFEGTGTVNCVRGYRFWVTAIDGNVPGGGGTDKFRIRIVQIASGTVIYDNQIGDTTPLELSMAATVLSSGSIDVD